MSSVSAPHNHTYFIPTSRYSILDVLFSTQGVLSPVVLYDLARFVEDFVLCETLFVPYEFRRHMVRNLSEHDPACDSFLLNGEDWMAERIEEKYPRLFDFVDADQSLKLPGITILNNVKTAFIAAWFGIRLQDVMWLIMTLRLPHLYDDKIRASYNESTERTLDLYDLTVRNIEHPLALLEANESVDFVRRAFSYFQLSVSSGAGFISIFKAKNERLERQFYRTIESAFRVTVARIERVLATHFIYTPPLLAILLDRCKSREDLPQQLCRLRAEFFDLRETINTHEQSLIEAESLKDKIEIVESLENAQEILSRKLVDKEHKTLVRRGWDFYKEPSIWKSVSKTVDSAVDHANEWNGLRKVHRYVDIYNFAMEVKQYERLLERVFGANRIDHTSFLRIDQFTQSVNRAIQ